MRFIDFIYFISYKAYVRGNKDRLGAFFVPSLWVSLLQFIWVFISLLMLEYFNREKYFMFLDKFHGFAIFLLLFIVLNNTYLGLGNRKSKILNRFHLSEAKEKFYWVLLIIIFFISFILAGRMGFLRKEMFG